MKEKSFSSEVRSIFGEFLLAALADKRQHGYSRSTVLSLFRDSRICVTGIPPARDIPRDSQMPGLMPGPYGAQK